eukprot:jgi/Mesvir1/268/Mv13606-RA.3
MRIWGQRWEPAGWAYVILATTLIHLKFVAVLAQDGDEASDRIIGIDLGTTFSCVAVFRHGRVDVIPNDQGSRTTPSWVAFADKDVLVGEAAVNQVTMNPEGTVYDIKRLIGRKFTDNEIQSEIEHLPYNVINKGGKPYVKIQAPGAEAKPPLSPEEVSAMILSKMKHIAEKFLGGQISKAVITVPAYFNDAQRQATKDAGVIAGMDVVRIINEPTAAALAFGLDSPDQSDKRVLVFDFGGGTLDVSILLVGGRIFQVLATSGNTHLGGEDFVRRMVSHFVDVMKKKTGKDLTTSPRAMARLRQACERAKLELSGQVQTRIMIESIMDGADLSEPVSRALFEMLCMDLIRGSLEPIKTALAKADLKPSDIDDVLLVGGSTRIPKVQQLIREFFGGREPNRGVHPDEAVCHGAAIQGSILRGGGNTDERIARNDEARDDDNEKEKEKDANAILLDVTPLTLGIETATGSMAVIIPSSSLLPAKNTKTFSTRYDGQTEVMVRIFEGDAQVAKENRLLGQMRLTGIPPAPRGARTVEVTFEVDTNGKLGSPCCGY